MMFILGVVVGMLLTLVILYFYIVYPDFIIVRKKK